MDPTFVCVKLRNKRFTGKEKVSLFFLLNRKIPQIITPWSVQYFHVVRLLKGVTTLLLEGDPGFDRVHFALSSLRANLVVGPSCHRFPILEMVFWSISSRTGREQWTAKTPMSFPIEYPWIEEHNVNRLEVDVHGERDYKKLINKGKTKSIVRIPSPNKTIE